MICEPSTLGNPAFDDGKVKLYRGDALNLIQALPSACVDLVLTDPPYSSGGMMRGDRMQSTGKKYLGDNQRDYDDFTGDNRDQRSFHLWCSLWLGELQRTMKPGAIVGLFTDWRQLPTVTDALQVAGFVWRGVVPWCKPFARPTQGRWSSSAEYLVWGTAGPRPLVGPTFSGYFVQRVSRDRRHQTEKPMELLRELVRMAWEPDSLILDPFSGSGTTLKAAQEAGQRAIGFELSEAICRTAAERLREPVQGSLIGAFDPA